MKLFLRILNSKKMGYVEVEKSQTNWNEQFVFLTKSQETLQVLRTIFVLGNKLYAAPNQNHSTDINFRTVTNQRSSDTLPWTIWKHVNLAHRSSNLIKIRFYPNFIHVGFKFPGDLFIFSNLTSP